ncbi:MULTISPECIES: DUF58 domain-containing protein [Sporosarcina]|uniref:DUF58 domain-containing protein n=1 Tax=Sporosarcina TaxID=1569 RepID=UPI0006939130|nr:MULTISPECIES: DUF58 domain-containing protein [Sporosarcina]WJY27389.1 DUF58 domain-containing protein [Sporosarcina sp. 0.2-SM1T-5]
MMRRNTVLAIQMLFVAVLIGGAFVFAKFQGGMVSWTVLYFLLPFAFYSFCIALYPAGRMSVTRQMEQPLISVGEKTAVKLTVRRAGRFPLLYLLIREFEETGTLTQGRTARLVVPGFRKEFDLNYELMGTARGEHFFPSIQLEVADFFGWIRKKAVVAADGAQSYLVFPETARVNYVPIGSNHEQGTAESPFSLMKETTIATSVREYQPGDRVSWIHWKSFARTQTLMTKEFENKRGEKAVLLLDARESETFEEQIRFAASVLKEAADRHSDLAFVTTDAASPVIRTITGGGELKKALTLLARMKPLASDDGKTPNYTSALQGTGAVVVISGNPDPLFLQPVLAAAGMQPVYCFVIRKTAGDLPETVSEQVKKVKSLGVHVRLLSSAEFDRSFQEVART